MTRQVNITELRHHLQGYLAQVRHGEELQVTSRGKVIARIVPARDESANALARLAAIRSQCRIGDVMSPVEEAWDAEHGRL
ncbi:MAG: type II toxin-antitoxin system prevent-host-death family antitoxin [Ectothiorhodospiraceae bacterium]|jgi:prevent-host-death family protein|nr:type II toxin-antitoxin system prevent-host-death family antitoxin [Ectothiorhodospiraceae bacterium]